MKTASAILFLAILVLVGCSDDDTGPGETISKPDTLTGPDTVRVSTSAVYHTGGAVSSHGHNVEYRFDFDADGRQSYSEWCASDSASTSWTETGTHFVKAQARCSQHTDILSPWSDVFSVWVWDLPKIFFATTITEIKNGSHTWITRPYNPDVPDTVGMFRPFSITYHGITTNGMIEAYKFYPLSQGVELEGQDQWTEDLSDTIRYFPNNDAPGVPDSQALESGVFRLATWCRDSKGYISEVDVGNFSQGVCQVVVNFIPDTEISRVGNTYVVGGVGYEESVDFEDGIPDTVPYESWVRIDYDGWDDSRDSSLCTDDLNKCIGYQVQYERDSDRVPGASSRSRWLPDEPEDNNPFGTPDSTSMNIGSLEYAIRARAVDEYGKPDLTMFDAATGSAKSEVEIIGNFDPTLDETHLHNYDGAMIPNEGDTIVWDWWNPANYHGNQNDTLDFSGGEITVVKTFYFNIAATGHDHPKDPSGSGVKNWFYLFTRTDNLLTQPIGRSGEWVAGTEVNVLEDRAEFTYRYDFADDPGGRSFFENPPDLWNTEFEYSIYGRDIGAGEEFSQYMFLNGERTLLNRYPAAWLGRWTETERFRFFLSVQR